MGEFTLMRLRYVQKMEQAQQDFKNIVIIVGDSINRDGSEKDVKKIHRTFEEHYNAEIYNWMDRTKLEYKKLFSDLKKNREWGVKFSKCKFVAVFCLFHGETDGRLYVNNSVVLLKCYFLNPLFNIKQLDGKLKWLIVQACRGSIMEPYIQADGVTNLKIYLDYYMISYCTGEGLPSYQLGRGGKIFIQYLCDQLKDNAENAHEKPLISLIKIVNEKVQKYGVGKNFSNFPKPEYSHNLNDDRKLS